MKISKIFLYDEPSVPELKISWQSQFIKETFGIDAQIRKNIFVNCTNNNDVSYRLACCRIFNTKIPFEKHSPTPEEVAFENARLMDTSATTKTQNIVMYDGFEFQQVLSEMIPLRECQSDQFHVVFTNKLMCTYDYEDYRYHGRAIICSNPTIISTSGIIEAPAKPRQYYVDLISRMAKGLNLDSAKKRFQGSFLEYHDKRLSSVTEGYLMQAIFYYITGQPFCKSKHCRLNNAHWQEDLLFSQIQIGKLCDWHQKILDDL